MWLFGGMVGESGYRHASLYERILRRVVWALDSHLGRLEERAWARWESKS